MADVLTTSKTFDVQIDSPKAAEIVIGNQMDKGGIVSITKNGKHVVSGYDLAEVDVQPLPSQTKEVTITENGTTEVTPDEGRLLDKVVVKADTTKAVMTEYIKNGGKLAYYSGTELPPVDWEQLGYFDYTKMFHSAKGRWVYSNALLISNCYAAFSSYKGDGSSTIIIDLSRETNTTGMFEGAVITNLEVLHCNKVQFNENIFKNTVINGYINEIDCGKMNLSLTSKYGRLTIKGSVGGFIDYGKNRIFSSSDNIDTWIFSTREDYVRVFDCLYDLNLRGVAYQYPPTIKCELSLLTDNDIKIATDKGWTIAQI